MLCSRRWNVVKSGERKGGGDGIMYFQKEHLLYDDANFNARSVSNVYEQRIAQRNGPTQMYGWNEPYRVVNIEFVSNYDFTARTSLQSEWASKQETVVTVSAFGLLYCNPKYKTYTINFTLSYAKWLLTQLHNIFTVIRVYCKTLTKLKSR